MSLFTILDPKIDVLIVGYGDNTPVKGARGKTAFPVDPKIILKMRQKGVSMELLTTENAIATYNYLVEEGRVVAAALIPPNHIKVKDQDIVDTKARRKELYGKQTRTGLGRTEEIINSQEKLCCRKKKDERNKMIQTNI